MKSPRIAAPLLLLIALSCAGAGVRPAAAQVYHHEVRGVWLTNVDSDVLFSKDNIASAMDYLAANGITVVYPVVWNKGYTLYPSDVMAETFGEAYRIDPFFAGQRRDPLAEVVAEAHRVGIEVIPWFEFGFATSFSQDGGHILAAKPEWAALNRDGNLVVKNGFDWMNGLHPEVQDFMLSLIREVAEGYDVDGVQGDDRLPAMPVEGGYDPTTTALYEADTGKTPPTNYTDYAWQQWRADQLTAFAGRLYRMVKDVDPNLTVTLSPSIWPFSFNEYLQDWPAWLDSGYVDLVHPQAYPPPPRSVSQYATILNNMLGPVGQPAFGYIDEAYHDRIMPGMLIKAGSDLVEPARVLQMVEVNRAHGLRGEVYFFYEGLGEKNDFLADTLGRYVYPEPGLMPTREGLWRPEALVVNEGDDAVAATGTWTEDAAAAGFEGVMLAAAPGTGATRTYTLEAPYDGTYDVYAFVPRFRANATTDARYTVDDGTPVTVVVDQRTTYNTGFVPLGQVTLAAGASASVTLDADAVTDGRSTYADAVMLVLNRKATPELFIPVAITSVGTERPDADAPAEVPGAFALEGAYPNPFNPSTTVRFRLHRAGAVTLAVYDALGRRVATLLDGATLPASRHEVAFDASALASGVYLVRLHTEAGTAAFPLALVK